MASKDLKVNVIVNAKTKQLDTMFKKLNKMQTKLNKQATAQNKVTNAVNKTNKSYSKQKTLVDQLTTKVHRLANAYLGVMAARAAITTSDTITKAENKLNYLNGGDTTATQQQLDKMYTSSQKVYMGYADMMSNVSKSMTLAGDAFGGNIDNAIRFQEIMSEAYTLSGSSAAEQSSSMYQMIQGLGSGVLQGDELRSVREGASLAYKAIEEYAQGIYGAETNLKDLASEGKITSDIVVAAILQNGEKMDAAFAQTSMTFEQAWTNMKNTAVKSFEPVLQKLNDLLNSPVGDAIINGIGRAIQIVAGLLLWIFGVIENIFLFVQTNWGVISNILYTLMAILGGVLLYYLYLQIATGGLIAKLIHMGSTAVATAIKWLVSWATMSIPMLLVIAIIVAIVVALIWMSDSWADACGNIVGAVFWLGATILNIVIGLINGIIQFIWTKFVEPWIGIIEWVLNVFNGGFNSFGDAVKNLLGQIISWFLSLGKVVTKIIDAIFGTSWTDGLNSLQDEVLSWGKNENAITLSREAPEIDRINATDAFASGYNYGEQFGNWTADKVSGLKDKISGALNLGGLPTDEITPNLEDINSNTEVMADSMQLTAEDLKYLRDVANMEWKKEFTTANITVDMTNNNTVNNDFDLNSLAVGLRDLVEEEMYAVANGTYA